MTTELLKRFRDALELGLVSAQFLQERNPKWEELGPRVQTISQALDAANAALAQPADKDAWLARADQLLVDCVNQHYDLGQKIERNESIGTNADSEFIAMKAHFRTRPQPAGFVPVPVEPMHYKPVGYIYRARYSRDSSTPPWKFSDTTPNNSHSFEMHTALIATKGDGK